MAREDRLRVLERIREYEEQGRFNDDVEEDAPCAPIQPDEVDYINKKLSNKFMTRVANFLGKSYFENMIRHKKLIIKEIRGIENAKAVKGGAIVTCNHFHLSDNYAVYRTIKPALKKRHYLYKVIKESNYVNFTGPVRIMMRHANTMPLSSSYATMRKFFEGMRILLNRGEKILIYPEQAMWFNYRKPRPLKPGAFKFAAKFNVPIIPVFICMKDSDVPDDDGFPVQELYVHYLHAIYPDSKLTVNENAKRMAERNYEQWVNVYELFYNEKLPERKDAGRD